MVGLPNFRRLRRKISRELTEMRLFFIDLVLFSINYVKQYLYGSTLGFTKRFLSRRPTPPKVQVKDVRCKRIRLQLDSTYSSPFNVEEFEVEWRRELQQQQQEEEEVGKGTEREKDKEPPAEWTSVGKSDLTARTVARLKPDTPYQFRVRAWNQLGCSGWSDPVSSRTKLDPTVADGGGYGPGGPDKSYSWTQTASEVCANFKLPAGASKRDIELLLKPDSLSVSFRGRVLLEGELYGTVRGIGNGSTWYVERERDSMMLVVMMEKQVKSLAPKFDYWRSLVLGHPEIDTHQIVSDGQATRMLDPGQLDPYQMQNMGLGHLSGAAGAARAM